MVNVTTPKKINFIVKRIMRRYLLVRNTSRANLSLLFGFDQGSPLLESGFFTRWWTVNQIKVDVF